MGVSAYHTGFVVQDLDRSVKFYTEGLGLECEEILDLSGWGLSQVVGYEDAKIRAAFLVADDGQILELLQYKNPPVKVRDAQQQHTRNLTGASHLGFFVDDAKAAYERCVKLGAKKLNPPVEVLPGLIACYIQDPDGNWFEIVEDKLHNASPFKVRQNRTRPPKK